MIENATVSIYEPIAAKNDEGTPIKTWGYKKTPADAPAETFRADVQPKVLSLVEQQLYGISNQKSDVKSMFSAHSLKLAPPNRAIVTSDFDGLTLVYEIRAHNLWPMHSSTLLVPVVGE